METIQPPEMIEINSIDERKFIFPMGSFYLIPVEYTSLDIGNCFQIQFKEAPIRVSDSGAINKEILISVEEYERIAKIIQPMFLLSLRGPRPIDLTHL